MARRGLLNEFSRPNHGTPPQMHCSVSAMGRFMAAPRRAEGAISSSTPHTGHVSATPGHSLVGLYVIRMYSNCRQACRNFCAGPALILIDRHSLTPRLRASAREPRRRSTNLQNRALSRNALGVFHRQSFHFDTRGHRFTQRFHSLQSDCSGDVSAGVRCLGQRPARLRTHARAAFCASPP